MAPPITAVFILAFVWERMTEPGAFYGILAGFGVGLIRFILEFVWRAEPCPFEDTRPIWIKYAVDGLVFLHFSPVSFLFTSVVVFVVSIMTKPIEEKHVSQQNQCKG